MSLNLPSLRSYIILHYFKSQYYIISSIFLRIFPKIILTLSCKNRFIFQTFNVTSTPTRRVCHALQVRGKLYSGNCKWKETEVHKTLYPFARLQKNVASLYSDNNTVIPRRYRYRLPRFFPLFPRIR